MTNLEYREEEVEAADYLIEITIREFSSVRKLLKLVDSQRNQNDRQG